MKSSFATKLCAIAALFSLLSFIPQARAQNESGIGGTVTDATGAVLPNATVKLTSEQQGTVRTQQTNASGVYNFTFLPAGPYDIEISSAGFKTFTQKGIVLAVAQNVRQDYKLELGNVSENITVSAAAATVNTESAEMGTVVDNTRVVEMPLNGRVFYQLAPLTPGVQPPAQNDGQAQRGGFNVLGSCSSCNNFTLNGMNNNDPAIAAPAFRPSVDAIQEFNLLTGIYGAQYGYGSGGQVIVTTRSGSNQYHGSVYDFLRNSAMDSRNFFLVGPKASFKRNQFGGTFGGPIRKDKTFFFYSYEGLRLSQQETTLVTVPTQAEAAGDFSALLPKIVIKDPATGIPFPNNVIPSTQLSPVGKALMALFPAPTFATPAGSAPSNNYDYSGPSPENYNANSLKIDHTFSDKDSGFLTGNYYKDTQQQHDISSTCTNEPLPGFICNLSLKEQIYGISETHIFSATRVNEFRYSWTETYTPSIPATAGINFWGQFGVNPLISGFSSVPDKGYPSVTVTGYTNSVTNVSFSSGNVFERADPRYQITDTFSWTRGKHTIKIGGDHNHLATNNLNIGTQSGTLTFTNSSTGPTSGYGLADLLLGLPATSANAPLKYKFYIRDVNVAAFIQDDYKVSARLTLNLGLRWEMNTPPVDYGHRETNFNPALGIPVTQSNPAPGAPETAPVGFGEHTIHFDWHGYAPRVGFAWQPFQNGKTVIRGGGGTFISNFSLFNSLSSLFAGDPYSYSNAFTSTPTQPLLLSNPFPTSGASVTINPTGADMNFRQPRIYEWSLGLQQQLTKDMIFEATYFGSSGNHLQVTQNINQPAPGAGTQAAVNARRPYSNYGTINFIEWDGNSHFQSLQLNVRKRYGYGLSFIAGYSYAKSIDDLGALTNAFDFRTARGLSSFDLRHRFVISPVYELPFGKGKPYVSSGPAAMIVGGWQVSTLFQWQTGVPLTATLSGNFSNSGGTTDRPNLIGNPNANAPQTPQQWFNTSAFQVPLASGVAGAPYTFGNEGRGVITSPGLVNMDLSLVRNFQPREWMRLQFRGEFFNLFNHPNFGLPNLVANTPAFGTITATTATGSGNRVVQVALKVLF